METITNLEHKLSSLINNDINIIINKETGVTMTGLIITELVLVRLVYNRSNHNTQLQIKSRN